MQCIVSTCDSNNCNLFQKPTYFKFPKEPLLCAAWLRALDKKDWQPMENSAVCSNHFLQDDLLENRSGLCKLRIGAVPVINVQVCRICFAIDCKLYPITGNKVLHEAYECLTGLLIENEDKLSPYLCTECGHRVMSYARFRTKSLDAHSILLEIFMKNNCITQQSVQAVHGIPNRVRTNVETIQSDLCQEENMITNEQADSNQLSNLLNDIIVDCIKDENDDIMNQDILETATNHSLTCIASENVSTNCMVNTLKTDNIDVLIRNGVDKVIGNNNNMSGDTVSVEVRKHNAKRSTMEAQEITKILEDINCTYTNGTQRRPETEADTSNDSLPLRTSRQNTISSTVEAQEVTRLPEDINCTNVYEYNKPEGKDKSLSCKLCCDMCPYQSISKIHMSSHLKAHSAIKSYDCSMCYYKTIHNRSLIWHSRVHSGEKPYPCDICNKTFSQKSSLLTHSRLHSGKKPYLCNICNKKFSEQTTLRRHLRIHTGERPYPCELCNKTFSQKSHLKYHIQMHSGEKPYFCDFCKKAFAQKAHLKKHLQVHNDELQYECDICNKIFRHHDVLKKHLKKHSNNKSYSCEVCKKVFSQKRCLKVHLKKHSGEKS